MLNKRHFNLALIFALMAITFVSCYPRKDVYTDDYDIAATFYDAGQDFKEYKTIYVIDSVFHIIDEDDDNNLEVSRKYDSYILDLIRQNFMDYGYEFILDPEADTPDVAILVSAMATRATVISYYGWGGYYPGWGWWGGGYYPYYPWGGTYAYNYDLGTIFIDMFDTKSYDPVNDTYAVPWLGVVNGLLNQTGSDIKSRLTYNINQCFIQSPYLKVK